MSLRIPDRLAASVAAEGWGEWLAALPASVASVEARWGVEAGEPFEPGGVTSWAAPARRVGGERWDLVVKVTAHHEEVEGEAAGLAAWDGHGAARLVAVDRPGPGTTALLLERCLPGSALSAQPEEAQDVVVTGLLRRLWLPAGAATVDVPGLRDMCARWARGVGPAPGADPGLVAEGLARWAELSRSGEQVLLCTDLHAGNVLAARREPWLAIDPKPHVGDPAYDLLQHMRNCPDRLAADPRGLCRRLADLAGVDCGRVEGWLIARCVVEHRSDPGLLVVARALSTSG